MESNIAVTRILKLTFPVLIRVSKKRQEYIIKLLLIIKNLLLGAGEMAQRLRALTALPKVPSSIPSNHIVAHNHL
jgi:DMSO reductase anchor subunit